MSAVLAAASPRRIKATHRRRRKVTAGHFVQRYYDPQSGRFLSVDPMAVDMATAANFNRYNYAANNPYKFVDPDGRANALGIAPRVSEYSPDAPSQKQMDFTTEVVDTTVNIAVGSGRQDLVDLAKNWDPVVTTEAKTPQGHDADTTPGSPADGEKTFTLFSAGIMQTGNTAKTFNLEGIIAKGGSPAQGVVGPHELFGHGTQENGQIPSGPANESDATRRTWDALKNTPDAKSGKISCPSCQSQ